MLERSPLCRPVICLNSSNKKLLAILSKQREWQQMTRMIAFFFACRRCFEYFIHTGFVGLSQLVGGLRYVVMGLVRYFISFFYVDCTSSATRIGLDDRDYVCSSIHQSQIFLELPPFFIRVTVKTLIFFARVAVLNILNPSLPGWTHETG